MLLLRKDMHNARDKDCHGLGNQLQDPVHLGRLLLEN